MRARNLTTLSVFALMLSWAAAPGLAETVCDTSVCANCDTSQTDIDLARQLWEKISDPDDPYTGWAPMPPFDHNLVQASEAPHADQLGLYLNNEACASFERGSFVAYPGSILVKANFDNKPQPPNLDQADPPLPGSLTVMWKPSTAKDEVGGWFWAMFSPQADGEMHLVCVQKKPPFTDPGNCGGDKSFYDCYKDKPQPIAGPAEFCTSCHSGAVSESNVAFGDWVWNVSGFPPGE